MYWASVDINGNDQVPMTKRDRSRTGDFKPSGTPGLTRNTFHRFVFLERRVLSNRRTRDAVFLDVFVGSFLKNGKYAAGTFLFERANRTLMGSSVCFSREKHTDGMFPLSSLDFACDCVGLCMADFSAGPIKKGLQADLSWNERKACRPRVIPGLSGSSWYLDRLSFSTR